MPNKRGPRGWRRPSSSGEVFIDGEQVALVPGDNTFYGHGLPATLRQAGTPRSGATIFAYQVRHPEAYGVVEFGADGAPIAIVEKPRQPRSHWAVIGLYVYNDSAPEIAASLAPSARGELEITDLNNVYLSRGMLQVERFGRGYAWFDTGTHDSLLEASEFVRTIELRQGLKIACVEEVAYRMGYIDVDQLLSLAREFSTSGYGSYLERLVEEPC
jgi:glucose-1-phosphate thymidylyltransferase